MDSAQIQLDQNTYHPREYLTGQVEWTSSEKTKGFSLRLIYFTEGRGTQDTVIDSKHDWEVSPNSRGTESFRLQLPATPYSFSGQLITVQWAIEVVALPKEQFSVEQKFILSPMGKSLLIPEVESSQTDHKKPWWKGK